MLELGPQLTAACRAAIPLRPADRLEFVAQHLKAQAEGATLPTATAPADAPTVSRAELQVELSALADKLTTAVNAAARLKSGAALTNVAMQLLQQGGLSGSDAPAAAAASSNSSSSSSAAAATETTDSASAPAAAAAPATEGPTKKKTARFATSGQQPERVGEPPAPIAKEYEGEKSSDGLPEGKGKATYANGDVYEGEWRSDRREGYGVCVFGSGESYEGQWKADKRDGKGNAKYVTGDTYEGEWRFGKREGHGRVRDLSSGTWRPARRRSLSAILGLCLRACAHSRPRAPCPEAPAHRCAPCRAMFLFMMVCNPSPSCATRAGPVRE